MGEINKYLVKFEVEEYKNILIKYQEKWLPIFEVFSDYSNDFMAEVL
jgi:hypothetical protein